MDSVITFSIKILIFFTIEFIDQFTYPYFSKDIKRITVHFYNEFAF